MAASEASEGPVLSLISKRLRALRKKYNRILQMEEAVAQGKPINKEQEEVLRSKPAVSVLIDELEKLRHPLSAAAKEEVTAALNHHHHHTQKKPESAVEDLLNLLYFGSMFDVKSQNDFASMCLARTHERTSCLTYDYVTDDATDLLAEEDLDLISRLGGLLISRPADSGLSHRNALERCIEHAKAWLAKSDQPIEPNANVTYAKLREKLDKIMGLDYLTTSPVHPVAAAGSFVPFQVPIGGVSVPVPIELESSVGHDLQKEDETATFGEHETGGSQSSSVQEHPKDEQETENSPENVSIQQEQVNQEVEPDHNQRDIDTKEQQYLPRRGYQNQRERGGRGGSGGRRGSFNGGGRGGRRGGGGPYQNGRNQQHYDQPGNYYPRGYHNNRGGGGRGRGGGAQPYNHRSSAVQGGGHNQSDVGVGA